MACTSTTILASSLAIYPSPHHHPPPLLPPWPCMVWQVTHIYPGVILLCASTYVKASVLALAWPASTLPWHTLLCFCDMLRHSGAACATLVCQLGSIRPRSTMGAALLPNILAHDMVAVLLPPTFQWWRGKEILQLKILSLWKAVHSDLNSTRNVNF